MSEFTDTNSLAFIIYLLWWMNEFTDTKHLDSAAAVMLLY